jgi:hypothetical protein
MKVRVKGTGNSAKEIVQEEGQKVKSEVNDR